MSDRIDGKRDTRTPGQAMEFLVWTELIQQSRGLLHIFLPLLDSGLDGVAHRLTDGKYIPIQVKGRGLDEGYVQLAIPAESLVDDDALIIAGLLTHDEIGPTVLVIDEKTFKRLAPTEIKNGTKCFAAAFNMNPARAGHWTPYLVPRTGLAARLLGAEASSFEAAQPPVEELKPQDRHSGWLGFLGESEVIRRLAENSKLDLFRPFPDLEMVEILARNNGSGRFAGLQVKTGIPGQYGEAQLNIKKVTLAKARSTWLVGLAWLPQAKQFAEECLVIPTERLLDVADLGGPDYLEIKFHPGSRAHTRLDPYRQRLSELAALIGGATEGR